MRIVLLLGMLLVGIRLLFVLNGWEVVGLVLVVRRYLFFL